MPLSRRTALAGLAGAGLLVALAACARRAGPAPETVYPPLGRFVTVEGAPIHLLEQGPADAPAVVLIHGASGNLRDFAFDFMGRLTDRYRVIAVDRPGFGHSARGGEDSSRPDVQARKIRAAVAALGVERPIVLGHSWGASAALAWALDAPERTAGVVTLAGVTHPWPGSAGLYYTLGASDFWGPLVRGVALSFLSEKGVIGSVDRIFTPQTAPSGYAEYVGVGLALRAQTLRYNAQDIDGLKAFLETQRTGYPTLRPPLEILHGDADAIVPADVHARPLAETTPGARLTILPGVGHMPHHVAPEACVAAIDRIAETI